MTDTADHRSVIWALSASNFVIGMGAFVLIGLVTPIADDLSLSPARVGAAMTTYALAYALLSPLLVSLTGSLGRRRVLALAMALFACGNLASALAPDELFLHLSRIVAAAGAGMFTPVTSAVASALAPPDKRGKALANVLVGLTLAQVLGVPVGSFVGYTFGWRTGFFIVVALGLACIWLIWTRVPKGLSVAPASLRQLGRTLTNGPVILAITFTSSFLGAIYILYTFLAPLLEQTMGFGRNGVTAALIVFGVGAVAGNILGGRMSDRLGPFRTLIILCAAQAAITPVFSFLPLPGATVFALLLVWSIFGWSFMAGQQVRIIALNPDAASVILSLNAAAIYVGAAAGSAIGSWVLASFGIGALGIACGIGALWALGHMTLSRKISGR